MRYIAFAVVLLFAVSAKAADHTVRLQVNCDGEMVGWHFSQDNGGIDFDVQGFHFRKAFFTKIKARDESNPMHRGERYDETFLITGPGVYILDFSDWKESSRIEAAVTIDGVLRFSTSTAGVPTHENGDLGKWHTTWGPEAQRSPHGDREILIHVD